MDYYSKYLKYKSKYLELQKQAGGNCNDVCNTLKTTHKFNDFYAYLGAQLEPEQIKKMIKLKTINKFSDIFAYHGANLTVEQINKMIELKNPPYNFSDQYAYEGAKLKPEQRQKMINLKKIYKFSDAYSFGGASLLTDKQIERMIDLKNPPNNFVDRDAYDGAQLIDEQRNK